MRQLLCVSSGGLTPPLNTDCLQARRLRRQGSSSPHGSHLDAGHGAGHVKVAVGLLGHQGYAVAGLDVLGGVLPCGEEDCRDVVGGVGVETSDSGGHGGADEVLLDVDVDNGIDGGLGEERAKVAIETRREKGHKRGECKGGERRVLLFLRIVYWQPFGVPASYHCAQSPC